MDLSIIIVNWNSKDYLEQCLRSIFAETRALAFEVVVIDSASFDGCDRMLRESFPQVRFIQSTTNDGFARSNNRAARESTGDYLLFLNPDTELVGPAIETLFANLKALPNAGIGGVRLLNSDRTIQSSCIQALPTLLNKALDSEFLRRLAPRSRLWGVAPLFADGDRPWEVEAVSGACLMVSRSAFDEVGGFSEDYFMYAEDIDLSYKIRRARYTNYFVPGATVIHHGGSSSQQAESRFAAVMMPEATWRFFRKTEGVLYGMAFRCAMGASAIGRLMLLALMWCVSRTKEARRSYGMSWRKWVAVLRWSVHQDGLVKRYYPRQRPVLPN
jgi:GT2 family glycosyltransferase